VLCWTPLFSVAKRTLPHIDAFALGTLRYAIGIVLFVLLLAAVEGRSALKLDGRLLPATTFGVVGITGFNLFVWIGLALTRPEHASIILALQTPLGCVAAAIAGVFLVVTKGDPLGALGGGGLWGDLIVFCGALCWVTYTFSAARFPGWSPLRFTVLTCIPGAVGLLLANVAAIAAGWATVPSLETIASIGWQLLYFSVGTVVLGVLAFNNAARRLGPLNTMLMLNKVPVGVFAIEASLGRIFAAVELAGAGMVVVALLANNLYLRKATAGR
jgi:drug/metabolite transporter (DMT)-like permease